MIAIKENKVHLSSVLIAAQILVQEAIRDSFNVGKSKEDFRNDCIELAKLIRNAQEKLERL